MYLGALATLSVSTNPEFLAQSAHSVRELMEKLPELVDVETPAHKETLGQKANELADAYEAHEKAIARILPDAVATGAAEALLKKLFTKLAAFVAWQRTNNPRRAVEIGSTLTKLDVSGQPLPAAIQSLNIRQWTQMRDYFVNVAHHREATTESEFRSWLDSLERFLLERLQPRTFDDFALIDLLVKGEPT